MRSCFVPLCDKKWKGNMKRPMFFAPRNGEMFSKWASVLHNTRPFKQSNRVCFQHFHEDDIERYFQHTINGKVYLLERERWLLKPFAVPSQNLPTAEDVRNMELYESKRVVALERTKAKKRNVNDDTKPQDTVCGQERTETKTYNSNVQKDEKMYLNNNSSCEATVNVEDVVMLGASSLVTLFNDIYDEIFDVELPNTLWGVHRCPNRTVIMLTFMNPSKLTAFKILKIESTGDIQVVVASHVIQNLHMLKDKVTSTKAISDLLTNLDETKICTNAESSTACEIVIDNDEDEKVQLCKMCLSTRTNVT